MSSALISVGKPPANVEMDVVFVHGLNGHFRDTWTGAYEWAFWPRWISETLPKCRVWSFDYPASATEWYGQSMSLIDRATNCSYCLQAESIGDHPLVFITHSLGGLLTKQLLRHLKDTTGEFARPDPILTNLAGIVFFATPHSGSFWANTASRFSSIFRPSISVQELESGDRHLADLNNWFRVFASNRKVPLKVFAETQPMWKVGIVVDQTSADPGIPGVVPIPLDADHISICKFDSQDNTTFRAVTRFINDRIADKRPTYAEGGSSTGLSIHMGLDNSPVGYDGQPLIAEPQLTQAYKIQRKPDSLRICSDLPYAKEFERGGPVSGHLWQWSPFACSFPALDFKVANNGTEVVLISEAEFQFEYSRPVSSALLVFRDRLNRSIGVENEGAGPARAAVIRFNFAPADEEPDFAERYFHEVSVGDIYTSKEIEVSEELKRIDELYPKNVAARISQVAELEHVVMAVGEISWQETPMGDRRSCKFSTFVFVGPAGLGVPAPPSCIYDLRLHTNDEHYWETVPVSHEIKPGETDRFQVVLFCDTPTEHRFKVCLSSTTGKVFESPDITLEMFVPASAKRFGRPKREDELNS